MPAELPAGRPAVTDVVVVGGGQAALALGYYLRRSGLGFRILDAGEAPGGAWRHGWDSLQLFSPALYSSLPGWMMPGSDRTYPGRDEVVDYLTRYEARYDLSVDRPVRVTRVHAAGETPGAPLLVETLSGEQIPARAVIGATGTWEEPVTPDAAGLRTFRGTVLHSAAYRRPDPFQGARILVVGGGNSGAQILAELSAVAHTTWVTLHPPRFLPDDVDGRVLFQEATAAYRARQEGRQAPPPADLGDVVMVPAVRAARDRGALVTVRPPVKYLPEGVMWADGRTEAVDVVILATGFRPALGWLDTAWLSPPGRTGAAPQVEVRGTRSRVEPRLWLVGYGDWTGFASATLIGVGRSARATVEEVTKALAGQPSGG